MNVLTYERCEMGLGLLPGSIWKTMGAYITHLFLPLPSLSGLLDYKQVCMKAAAWCLCISVPDFRNLPEEIPYYYTIFWKLFTLSVYWKFSFWIFVRAQSFNRGLRSQPPYSDERGNRKNLGVRFRGWSWVFQTTLV